MSRRLTADQRDAFTILQRLVDPLVLLDQKTLARELGLLKRLRRARPDAAFWLGLKPAIPLDSLLYFCGPYGEQSLQHEWNLYQVHKAQVVEQERQEWERQIAALEDALAPEETIIREANALDSQIKTPRVSSKRGALDWVDSGTDGP